jgi:hypothetical protein
MMPYQLRRGGSGTCHYGHDSIMRGGSDDRATPTRTALRTTMRRRRRSGPAKISEQPEAEDKGKEYIPPSPFSTICYVVYVKDYEALLKL